MPNSTEVWPLWRHCQSLACGQPTAGTRGQTEQQHFPQETGLTQTGKNARSSACAQLHTKKEDKWPCSSIRKTPKQAWADRKTRGSEGVSGQRCSWRRISVPTRGCHQSIALWMDKPHNRAVITRSGCLFYKNNLKAPENIKLILLLVIIFLKEYIYIYLNICACLHDKSLQSYRTLSTLWTVAHQVPLFMGFSK